MALAETTVTATRAVLEVEDLRTVLFTRQGAVRAVDGVSFSLRERETLALVGESGCGKSMTALSLMRLVPEPPGRIVGGSVRLLGRDLLQLAEPEMRAVRGKDISMIFQEPMTSLNPVLTIGTQIAENVVRHWGVGWREARDRAREVLELVRLSDPKRRLDEYPHQLSGGMRQRVMIAMALSCDPKVLIADEPTTALDVTIQAQILDLLRELQQKNNMAIMLITHDLGVIAEMADVVVVMYLGRVVEEGLVDDIFHNPKHPYTRALLKSIPSVQAEPRVKLPTISGGIPHPYNRPTGCPFYPRCPEFMPGTCDKFEPELLQVGDNQEAACFLYGGIPGQPGGAPVGVHG